MVAQTLKPDLGLDFAKCGVEYTDPPHDVSNAVQVAWFATDP